MVAPLTNISVTVPAGTAQSAPVQITSQNDQIVGILTPAALDGTVVTMSWSLDGISFYAIFDRDGSESRFTFRPQTMVPIQSLYGFYEFPYVRVRCGPKSAPVIQSADRVFQLICQ